MATVKISSNLRFNPVDPDAEVKASYEKKLIDVRTELTTQIESEKIGKEKNFPKTKVRLTEKRGKRWGRGQRLRK